jgi:tetratricopeptide (TPR) repeat protein
MVKKLNISDIDFEIQFYEGILKKKPNFVEALSALGDLYTKRGLYEKGLEIDIRLVILKPNDSTVLYNLACSFSLLKDIDKALRSIKKAINCGYDDFYHLEQDGDLINLRDDSRFKRYFLRIRNKRVSKIKPR